MMNNQVLGTGCGTFVQQSAATYAAVLWQRSFKEGISASRRRGESLNLIPSPAASRRGGRRGGVGFSLSFINLTACANSGGVGLNQSDTDTLAAVFWVTWEAHPGPGAFRDLLLQESPHSFVCSYVAGAACLPAWRLTRSSQQSRAELKYVFFFFIAGFQLGVEERLM